MSGQLDIIVRGGTVLDGTGAPEFTADIGVADGRIVEVGKISSTAAEELDASGCIVTPGFVDIHTHYDGQATWENCLQPSSGHGVTSVVMGNCGVGFAPCRAGDRQLLIQLLEGVEDIPEPVMTNGLPWTWETFPDYLDVLATRTLDIDFAAQLPHSALRVYVMGERGANHEPATAEDLAAMRQLTTESIRAGAIGVSTSRSLAHRSKAGDLAPSVGTVEQELLAIARGLGDSGAGVFQLIYDGHGGAESEFALMRRIAEASGRPLSFSLLDHPNWPGGWRTMLSELEKAVADGLEMRAQIFPRPVGVLMGLQLSLHPFSFHPSYKAIADLPLAERVSRMRDLALRERMLAEQPECSNPITLRLIQRIEEMFVLGDPPEYEPDPGKRIGAQAAQQGVPAMQLIYDALLQENGEAILCLPAANMTADTPHSTSTMIRHPNTVFGLGDGGAHYGLICDASFPTHSLIRWVRDAAGEERQSLAQVINKMTGAPAHAVGLFDRGVVKPGLKADLNVIDLSRLTLHAPRAKHDLPGNALRIRQNADGYVATIASGQVTYRDGEHTGALPGRLVRGSQMPGTAAR
ncbi:N-acyl-D-amino-acid deacylase family protein [Sphingobium sp. TKS]|uniref:N-acyl-D-amino-acid deacylase family protein n=1 Tax=Sphingobium sp. TKS TaxID=1315974 RepID=UPI00076FE060|nr:amidohydrolase family protein [Sphingobium sp. TKS]AMK25584.1 amidohydrolase 3 [Sphingobium sp. TKS]